MLIMILLVIIGIWDLLKGEIPVVLLIILSVASVIKLAAGEGVVWIIASVVMIALVVIGIFLVRKRKMGGGDVWVLACLAVAWPLEVFWRSVWIGSALLCLTAIEMLFLTGDENTRIPMVPFLVLGYWI